MERNVVGWFEIPVKDMNRAKKFYEAVFQFELDLQKMGPIDMAWFPMKDNSPGTPGTLITANEFYKPSQSGVLIYFTAPSGDLKNEVNRVEAAGGKVIIPIRQVSEEYGYMAAIEDTEGNRIAIHSRQTSWKKH